MVAVENATLVNAFSKELVGAFGASTAPAASTGFLFLWREPWGPPIAANRGRSRFRLGCARLPNRVVTMVNEQRIRRV